MSDVVFILGAGASRDCGGPLMSDFLDISQELLLSRKVDDKEEEFKRVFEAIGGLQRVHSKAQIDLYNIESIFTALELGKVIKRFPNLSEESIDSTINALKALIVRTLEARIEFRRRNGRVIAPKTYRTFVDLIKGIQERRANPLSCSVITFNYDIALDYALVSEELTPNYCLTPQSGGGFPLLKLHGSVNWASKGAGQAKRIHPVDLAPIYRQTQAFPDQDDTVTKLMVGSDIRSSIQDYEVDQQPVIVPPSWNKADYHRDLTEVWSNAAAHLSESDYIFVIGYSLPETDSFFRHLYALGSESSKPLKKIGVFDPMPKGTAVDQRFRKLLGPGAEARYEYFENDFTAAIKSIKEFFGLPSATLPRGFFAQ